MTNVKEEIPIIQGLVILELTIQWIECSTSGQRHGQAVVIPQKGSWIHLERKMCSYFVLRELKGDKIQPVKTITLFKSVYTIEKTLVDWKLDC